MVDIMTILYLGDGMILNKKDLLLYEKLDMDVFHSAKRVDRIILKITKDPLYDIVKYLRWLRREEYIFNCRNGRLRNILLLFVLRKKNTLGNRLGFKIPRNTFGPGLTIFHHGTIIVNENAKIGANAKLHGNNCIGNNGKDDINPIVGDNLDMGVGSSIIGSVKLGNRVVVGAHSVVVSSFINDDITVVGVPAKIVNKKE